MLVKINRLPFAVGLILTAILTAGCLAVFVFAQSPKHGNHGEKSASAVSDNQEIASGAVTNVNLQNNRFVPDVVNITSGSTVRWTWVNGFHSTTSGTCCTADGLWNSGTTGTVGNTFDRTFSTPGTFPYFCVIHGQMMTGQIIVTAATATVSGRVLTQNGRGIKGARVILTDQANVAQSVTANHLGAYQFSNVATGQSYTLSVQARRCTFTPRSLSVNGNLTSEDIVCQ